MMETADKYCCMSDITYEELILVVPVQSLAARAVAGMSDITYEELILELLPLEDVHL